MMVDQITLYMNGIIFVAVKYFAFSSIFKPAVKKRWMFSAYAAFLIVTTQVFFHFDDPWLTLFANMLTSVALTFLFHGNASIKLVFAVLIYLSGILAEGITLLLINLLRYNSYGISMIVDDALFFGRSIVNLIHLPFIFTLILIFRRFIHRRTRGGHYKIPFKYTVTILLLLLGIILINVLFMLAVAESFYKVAGPIMFLNIISMGLIFLIIWVYNTILNYLEEFQKNQQKDQMLERWEVQYRTAMSSQKMIAELKHNMNFCFLSLVTLIKEGKMEEAEKQISSKVGNFDFFIVTGNMAIDTMLNYYQQRAKEILGIELRLELLIPTNLRLDANLTATILGNALENALEACAYLEQKQRYIYIKMEITKHEEILITIENPYTIAPVKDKTGNFITTKKDKKTHGIGLTSVQEILDEKDGHIYVEYSDNVFRFSLLFYNVLPDMMPNVTNVSPYITNV